MERALIILIMILGSLASEAAKNIEGNVVDSDSIPAEDANITVFDNDSISTILQEVVVEIIPKAGAEYTADSAGGIIKINLKRNRIDGLNGSAGMNLTSGEYKQWINPFLNLGLHSGKWTISLNGRLHSGLGILPEYPPPIIPIVKSCCKT